MQVKGAGNWGHKEGRGRERGGGGFSCNAFML